MRVDGTAIVEEFLIDCRIACTAGVVPRHLLMRRLCQSYSNSMRCCGPTAVLATMRMSLFSAPQFQ